nr:hypothetical protein [Paenibacillus bovis]
MRNTIELENYFGEVGVIEEPWTDIDGNQYVDKFKEVKLPEGLTLILADDGSATLVIENVEHTIKWDDEAAEKFSRFDELKAIELFGLINRKRWMIA